MHYLSLYRAYRINDPQDYYSKELDQIVKETPPCYYSYLIGINCIKWVSKLGINVRGDVINMIEEQIIACGEKSGVYSAFILAYYQLYAIYAEEIFDQGGAVEYARRALQVVIEIYGESSAQVAEKWFLLGNIMVDGEMYRQGLDAYLKSLDTLKKSQVDNMKKL